MSPVHAWFIVSCMPVLNVDFLFVLLFRLGKAGAMVTDNIFSVSRQNDTVQSKIILETCVRIVCVCVCVCVCICGVTGVGHQPELQ